MQHDMQLCVKHTSVPHAHFIKLFLFVKKNKGSFYLEVFHCCHKRGHKSSQVGANFGFATIISSGCAGDLLVQDRI